MRNRSNPSLYRAASEPFESVEAATEAMNSFCEAVAEARETLKIRDVVILVGLSYRDGEDEVDSASSLSLGSHAQVLPMLANAYGDARADYERLIEALQSGKRGKSGAPPRGGA